MYVEAMRQKLDCLMKFQGGSRRGTDRRGVFGGAAAETADQSVLLVSDQTDNDDVLINSSWV